jgi:hypothetical protein
MTTLYKGDLIRMTADFYSMAQVLTDPTTVTLKVHA